MPKNETKPAAATEAPKTKTPTHEWKSKELALRMRDGLKMRLISALDSFIDEAFPEEALFLIEGAMPMKCRYFRR